MQMCEKTSNLCKPLYIIYEGAGIEAFTALELTQWYQSQDHVSHQKLYGISKEGRPYSPAAIIGISPV